MKRKSSPTDSLKRAARRRIQGPLKTDTGILSVNCLGMGTFMNHNTRCDNDLGHQAGCRLQSAGVLMEKSIFNVEELMDYIPTLLSDPERHFMILLILLRIFLFYVLK